VSAVGMRRTKNKLFNDNPYVVNTPSPTVDIKGISLIIRSRALSSLGSGGAGEGLTAPGDTNPSDATATVS